jgi:hypothetical protein
MLGDVETLRQGTSGEIFNITDCSDSVAVLGEITSPLEEPKKCDAARGALPCTVIRLF